MPMEVEQKIKLKKYWQYRKIKTSDKKSSCMHISNSWEFFSPRLKVFCMQLLTVYFSYWHYEKGDS
jgi:hypothetical protein